MLTGCAVACTRPPGTYFCVQRQDAAITALKKGLAGLKAHLKREILTQQVCVQRQDAAITALKKSLAVLEAHLLHNTFLVGHRVTLADVVAGCNLYLGFSKVGSCLCSVRLGASDKHLVWTLAAISAWAAARWALACAASGQGGVVGRKT